MLQTLFGAAAALAVASVAHYLFWTWKLRVPGTEDEKLFVTTADGWRLCLGRRRPAGQAGGGGASGTAAPAPLPVLLVHGLAVNRSFMDFGDVRHSLAARFARDGVETFALDLRGHGESREGPGGRWTFDDYVRHDLPAAIEGVRRATGARAVLLAGHSQGALLALAAAGLYPDAVAGVLAMAGPTRMDEGLQLRGFARFAFLIAPWTRLLARMVAPFAGLAHPRIAQASMATRNADRPVLQRLLATCIEPIPRGVGEQFRWWIAEDLFCSRDRAADYRAALPGCRQPALFVAGPLDPLAPPRVVEESCAAWGGEKAFLLAGVAGGLSVDYGHGDMVFGRRAPEELYPRLSGWLAAQSRRG